MMTLEEFIKDKPFEVIKSLLEVPPYSLIIKETDKLYLLKYHQIDSDFSIKIVRQSRGIILEKGSNEVVCRPFDKFFNLGEKYAEQIDFNSATIFEKVDGSLMKVYWYGGKWNLATNGIIFAKDANTAEEKYSFADIFDKALKNNGMTFDELTEGLDKEYTHMFELVSSYTKIVINYPQTDIYYLSSRKTKEGDEKIFDLPIKKPKEYNFGTLEEVVEVSKNLPFNDEGYVLKDKDLKRVKIKSAKYVVAHHMIGNGPVTTKKVINLILTGETEEFCSYFPERKEDIISINRKIEEKISQAEEELSDVKSKTFDTRKDLAIYIQKKEHKGLLFSCIDGKIESPRKYIMGMRAKDIEDLIGG